MGVGAGLYMCDVVKKFTFAISSPDEFLYVPPARLSTASKFLTTASKVLLNSIQVSTHRKHVLCTAGKVLSTASKFLTTASKVLLNSIQVLRTASKFYVPQARFCLPPASF